MRSGDLNVVLVGTLYPTNIGSVARAMANMGADRLILVDPKCEINSKARQGAAGAQKRLEEITIYRNWAEFYDREGDGVRFAFCCRDGKQRQLWPLKDRLEELKRVEPERFAETVYLIFGPEDNGLSTEDMALANFRCALPTYGEFSSMNLAQAVLLALFIFQDFVHEGRARPTKTQKNAYSEPRRLIFPDQTIREWITAMGFDIDARKSSAYITFRRLLLQNTPTAADLMILEAILQQNIRKLREGPDPNPHDPSPTSTF